MISDKPRFIVQEANSDVILNRDLEVRDPKFGGQLSGPCSISFSLDPFANPWIDWGKNKQWVFVEMEFDGVPKLMLAGIVKSANPDPESGVMNIECYGFSDYPKNKPWLENLNPIAIDPFEVVWRVWNHVQSFSNAQLGVQVYPTTSGTQMLPGYGFDGSTLVFDFFALFIRAVDFTDCADTINGLSRDIPFDYFERCWWNEDRTEISKRLELAYPHGGVQQDHLAFVLGENVIKAELAEERDIDPVTDVGVRGWLPGMVYNARLGNTDDTQFREFVLEEDAKINSTERAAAWAKRKLQRRTVPKYWKKIVIDPSHPNAPFQRFSLGDSIFVRGKHPWYGEIALWHRVTSWAFDISSGFIELGLKVEGAFNYDPIEYNPDLEEELPPNDLKNGYFANNLTHWTKVAGNWFRVATLGRENPGCVRIDLDDGYAALKSERVVCAPGQIVDLEGFVRWEEVPVSTGDGFKLQIVTSFNGGIVGTFDIDTISNVGGTLSWQRLEGNYTIPSGVNEYSVQLACTSALTGGIAFWDDITAVKETP